MGEKMMRKRINDFSSNQQIKFGAILSYISIALNIGAGVLYTPWMVRQIGQSQYGLFTLANSLISLFMIDFGLSAATSKFVSEYHVQKNEEKVNAFLGAIYKLYLIVDLVILVALVAVFFFIDAIYSNLTTAELQQFKVVYCIAALYSVISFPFVTTNGILTAYEKFIQQKLADVIYRILTILLMVAALLNGYGLYALVTVNAIAGLTVIIYKLVIIRKDTPVRVYFKNSAKGIYKEVFGFSLWTTIASVAQRLVFNITPTILGMVSGSAEIAVFGIVTTIEGYAFTITNAINGMFMPKISKIYSQEDSGNNLMNLMIKIGRFQYLLNGLLIVGFISIGKEFVELWMGNDYVKAYYGIVMVLIPGLFYNSLQIAHTAMMVRNKVKPQAEVNIATGIVNVILSYMLSSKYGMIGSCLSIFCAYMFRCIALVALYGRQLEINMKHFVETCYLKYLPIIIGSIVLGMILNNLIIISGWLGLTIKAILIVCVYILFCFFICYSWSERKMFLMRIVNTKRKK